MNANLIDSATTAAMEITNAAAEAAEAAGVKREEEHGYGVAVEVLQDGEWVRANDIDEDCEIDAVRFYDREGSRSEECSTAAEIDKIKNDWITCAQRDFINEAY